MQTIRIILAGVLLALLLAGGAWYLSGGSERSALPLHATLLPEGRLFPEFSLTDDQNRPFTRDSLRGHTSLVFFGFTHCPDICPATLQQLANVRRRLAEAAPSAGDASATPLPEILLISVDPERDTPEQLERYVDYFGDGITGVTGDIADIRALTVALGIFFEKSGAGDHYTVNHSTAVLVVDRNAELQAIFSGPHQVDSFVHDLPLLMASQ
ncbi:MAG: SCO family protein [Woeseiaceae bacterium]